MLQYCPEEARQVKVASKRDIPPDQGWDHATEVGSHCECRTQIQGRVEIALGRCDHAIGCALTCEDSFTSQSRNDRFVVQGG